MVMMMMMGGGKEKREIKRRTLSTSAPAFSTPAYDMLSFLLLCCVLRGVGEDEM